MTTDLKSMTVEEAFGEWEGTEETYRWSMIRAAACHGTPDDSYPFQSGWKAAEKEYSRRLEEVQQKIAEAKAEALEEFMLQFGDEDCPPRLVDDALAKAAEYRAKAGRKE